MVVGVEIVDEADPHASDELGQLEDLLGGTSQRALTLGITEADPVIKDVADLSEVRSAEELNYRDVVSLEQHKMLVATYSSECWAIRTSTSTQ